MVGPTPYQHPQLYHVLMGVSCKISTLADIRPRFTRSGSVSCHRTVTRSNPFSKGRYLMLWLIPAWFTAMLLTWAVITSRPRWRPTTWTTKTVVGGYALLGGGAIPAFLVPLAIALRGESISPSPLDLVSIGLTAALGVLTVGLYTRGRHRKAHSNQPSTEN